MAYQQEELDKFVIPKAYQPFLNTEINFRLFIDLLSDKVDIQRVSFSSGRFKDLSFSCAGYPKLIIEIFRYLTGLSHDEIIRLKNKQYGTEFRLEPVI